MVCAESAYLASPSAALMSPLPLERETLKRAVCGGLPGLRSSTSMSTDGLAVRGVSAANAKED
jgi:hypothetical protein